MKAASERLQLRPLALPPHERHVLPNGLTLHVVPRAQLPLVSVKLMINAGSAFDPPGKLGAADFASRLLRRGAAGRSADAISEAVEFVGASIGGYANEENVIVALSTPAKHLAAMLGIFADVALAPEFPEAEVELLRRRTLAQLQNELDDPGELAERGYARAVWGQHPFGLPTEGTKATVEALVRADLVHFHRSRLGPHVAHLFVVGDVTSRQVLPLVEAAFGKWTGGPAQRPQPPAWPGLAQPGRVLVVDKPEQTQVQLRIGAVGVRRGHPDHFAISMMNAVLGGSFTSRLITEIRVKRGLSYGAGSSWDMMSGAGTFSVSSFTKTDAVQKLIDVALAEVKKMRERGPTAQELATVQRYVAGLYPARVETNEAISSAIADVEHYGLPADWVSNYRHRVVAVTREEAAQAARTFLPDRERTIVLVGNAKQLAKKVERYGAVEVVTPEALG